MKLSRIQELAGLAAIKEAEYPQVEEPVNATIEDKGTYEALIARAMYVSANQWLTPEELVQYKQLDHERRDRFLDDKFPEFLNFLRVNKVRIKQDLHRITGSKLASTTSADMRTARDDIRGSY